MEDDVRSAVRVVRDVQVVIVGQLSFLSVAAMAVHCPPDPNWGHTRHE